MTPEDREELLKCSQRIAEILYRDACEQEHPIINLGAIESTVRGQIQAYVTPAIGEFFVKPSAAPARDMSERSIASLALYR